IINAGGGQSDNPPLGKPHLTGVTYDSGSNQVQVKWEQVNHANAYRVELLQGSSVVATQNLSSRNLEANFDASGLAAGTYDAQVTAAAANYQSSTSDKASIVKLDTADTDALTYSDNHLHARWQAVGGASAGYQVELYKDGQPSATTETTATSATFDTQGVASYTFRVRAKGDASHIAGDWSAQSNAVRQLAEPSISALSYANGKIHVTLASAVGGASGYSLQLLQGTTPTGSVVRLNDANQLTADIDATNLPAGTYRVEAMANAPDDRTIPSGWSVSNDVISKLSAPGIGSLSYADGNVTVGLSSSVGGASGYDVQLIDSAGQPVGTVTHLAPEALAANVSLAGLPAGILRARVIANAPDNKTIPSDPAISTETVERLAKVVIMSASMTDGFVNVNWTATVAGATEYVAQLIDANNTPVGSPVRVGADALTAAVSIAGVPAGTYRAGVLATSSAPRVIPSEWSLATTPLVNILPTPTGLSLGYEGGFLRAAWQPIEGAGAVYRYQFSDSNNVIMGQADTNLTSAEARIGAVTLMSGLRYVVKVRAQSAGALSDWTSAQLLVLPTPIIQSLEYTSDTTLSVGWQAVAGANGFAVRLLDQSGNPLATQPDISFGVNTATLSGNGIDPNTPLKVQVRIFSASAQSDWCAPVSALVRPSVSSVENTEANVLSVSWQPVTDASDYDVQIQTTTGAPLSPAPEINITGTSARITGTAINAAMVYSVRVRARSSVAASAWSSAVVSLATPNAKETSIVNNQPVFSWMPVAGSTGYEVQVLDAATNAPLQPQPDSTINGTQATFKGLVAGSTYKVRVRAFNQQAKSAWSASLTLSVPVPPPPFEFSYLDAVSWYDTQPHLRVYNRNGSIIMERGYDAVWYVGSFTATGTTIGSTSWLIGKQFFIRNYVRGSDGKITEYCWDKDRWYVGAFRADGTGAAPASWLTDKQIHLRVYVGNSAGKITEQCWDKDRWYVGAFSADGIVADATAWLDKSGQQHLRTYVIEASGKIKEYCWDKDRWYVGIFNATGTNVSVTSWVDAAGQVHVRLYVRGSDSKITEYCWDKDRWYVGAFRADGIIASATSWLANGQQRIRVYVHGSDGRIKEYCWDKDRWYVGAYSG
ncbi:MAG TPA: fibronectin type III domain-containing protein, partial [Pyrinomonadaceae bacterium]|nr:fibronectin type III domain-containing protein [Pyrinomonadaceae bacterium]